MYVYVVYTHILIQYVPYYSGDDFAGGELESGLSGVEARLCHVCVCVCVCMYVCVCV
jgi:hypothetical protein